ncbi:MAG: T9SS type A sorting domain-containing protein [Saprospiraceae bacterium]
MKKIYLLTLSLICLNLAARAQQDCCSARPLFGTQPVFIDVLNGAGDDDPIGDCSCLSGGEVNSFWFAFQCTQSGSFEFMIQQLQKDCDYDFALWAGDCPCENDLPPIACDDTGPADPVNGPFVPTGISKDPLGTFGVLGLTEFLPPVDLIAGRTYYLLVNNITNTTGFTLSFAGTALIGPAPNLQIGPISGETNPCVGASITYSVPPVPAFNTFYSWTITPWPGGPFTTNTNQFNVNWNYFVPGDFELCVVATQDFCKYSDPACIDIQVDELISFDQDVICYPGFYTAPDGTVIYSPGVYEFVYPSYLGCDSTVILTLTPAPASFIVRVETICGGDCYNFEGDTYCESGAYEKVYTNQYGCDSTILLNLIVFPTESIIEGLDTLDCNQPSIVLDGGGSVGGTNMTFLWRKGNQIVGTDTFLTVTTGGTYSLTTRSIVSGDTCEAIKTVTVIADFNLPANVTATAGTIDCNATATTLMGNSTTPGVTYSWTGPGGFTSNQQNPTVTVAGNYTLTVTAPNGCKKTATATVINTPPPTATATGGTIDCNNATVTLMGNANSQGVSYSWEGPGGTIILEQNPVVSVAGNYTLTVTAANGCTATAVVVVNDGTALPNASASTNGNLNCQASSVLLSGAGSSTGNAFSYLWTTQNGNILSGETTLTPTVNAAGNYLLTVTNNTTGCTNTTETVVVQSPPVGAQISSQTNATCFGEDNGSATAAGSGGNGTYTYKWSNNATGATISNIGAGNYSVTITDGENCTTVATVLITQPPLLEVNASATGQSVLGVNDGTATANPTGGTGNYTYLWSNGETTQGIADLAPGVYSVTVTDENGCEAIQSVNVAESDCNLKANIDKENVTCHGASDGSATLGLDNASPPIVYTWSNGDTTQTISGQPGGNYTVTATDGNGCEAVVSVVILEPATLNANATAEDETVPGAGDGAATSNPTGGTSPYSFLWNNGETTPTIVGLSPGSYTVVVTDTNGCQVTQSVDVMTEGCFISATATGSDVSCNGAADGQASANLTGGIAPFTYLWSNDETTATINNLEGGTYIVTVTDMLGCPAVAEVTISEPDVLAGEVLSVDLADCMATNGAASVSASGGSPAYQYNWSNSATGASVGSLAPGTYSVSISDANDCETILTIQVGVDDPVPPTVATQDISLEIGPDGTVSISPNDVDNGSMDDCQIASMTLDVTEFDCSTIGDNTVELTITDVGGNSATATATVTVVDLIPPSLALLQDISITLDANGNATISPALFDNGSTDNCGDFEWTILPTSFNCDNVGENDVEITATDAAGNASTATITVTVVDDIAPQLTCPEGLFLPYCDPVATFQAEVTDNCAAGINLTQTNGPASGSSFPTGNTTVSFEATDAGGNSATCSFTVTVPASMNVVATSQDVSCKGESDGSAAATATGGAPPYSYLWSNGATSPSVSGLPPGEYMVTVTDGNGCTNLQTVNITEPTSLLISLVNITNETGSLSNGSIDVSVSGGVTPYTYTWINSMGTVLSNDQDISGLPGGTYQLSVVDANGCESLNAFTIQSINSTSETDLDGLIGLFPNPTTGEVLINLNGLVFNDLTIRVYDVVGHETATYNGASGASQHKLNLSSQPSGVYLLKIQMGEHVVTKRLVVNH